MNIKENSQEIHLIMHSSLKWWQVIYVIKFKMFNLLILSEINDVHFISASVIPTIWNSTKKSSDINFKKMYLSLIIFDAAQKEK